MEISSQKTRSWSEGATARWLHALFLVCVNYSSIAYRGVADQLIAGQNSVKPPKYRTWRDGRRYRAAAYSRRISSAQNWSGVHWFMGLGLIILVGSSSFVGASAFLTKYTDNLPDALSIASLNLPQDSIIYDSSNKVVLADIHRQGYRHYEQKLNDMGVFLPQATLAIEDTNFYHEPAVNVSAVIRAAWVDYRAHRAAQGASTISQQLVKMRLTGNKSNLDRKVREAILAYQVEQSFKKSQILEMYLNTAFYGNNAYGISAASQSYFHTPTSKLTLGQASMLAGIPQNPSYNNPLVNYSGAKARQYDVLMAMVHNHDITLTAANTAFKEDLTEPKNIFHDANVINAPGFVSNVIDEMVSRFGTTSTYEGGLLVTSTLNWDLQTHAQDMVSQNVAHYESQGMNVHQGASVAIDPKTGEIITMVGSANAQSLGGKYNFAVWPPRNPGSSMKMFTYTAGIASGKYTMVTPISDASLIFPKDPYSSEPAYEPKNYDGRFHGTCQLQQCFLNSYNIPAVKVEVSIGTPSVVSLARSMGAPPWTRVSEGQYVSNSPLESYGPSLTLGGWGETPLQMASAASVIASGGILRPPHGIKSVTTALGDKIFTSDSKADKSVLDPKVAFIMAQIMSDDSNRAAVFGRNSNLTLPGRLVAAKTGTTDDFHDGWTVGYTPALATAFWFGNADFSPMPRYLEASVVAAPVWHDFMAYATSALGEPNSDWFAEPPGLGHAVVGGKLQWFMPGTSPSTSAPPLPKGIKDGTPPPKPAPPAPTSPPAPPVPLVMPTPTPTPKK